MPSNIDYLSIIDSLLNSKLMVLHDLYNSDTVLITNFKEIQKFLSNLNISILEENLSNIALTSKEFIVLTAYMFENAKKQYFNDPRSQENRLEDIYEILRGTKTTLLFSFCPSGIDYATELKRNIEKEISEMDVRVTKGMGLKGMGQNSSSQADVYYDSDKKKILLSTLNMLNDVIMSNGCSYKVSIMVAQDQESAKVVQYLRSKLLILEESKMKVDNIQDLSAKADKINSIPFSYQRCSDMLFFSDKIKRLPKISAALFSNNGDILVGNYVYEGIKTTETPLLIRKETLNLGAIVSGLPGSGKTASAKNILSQVAKDKRSKIIVVSPNDEWNQFGYHNKLKVVKVYDSQTPINFFKCGEGINAEKFYEDLSMLIASASNAGPYRNSIEKVLLSAFNKSYKDGKDPDPSAVYSNIELAVIEQHAKVTNTSVKYTKHGENIKAALQNLRLIISRPEFAYNNGIDFSFIIENGAVFDLSKVSNNMKPFFYALILNQVYGFAETFDIYGDDELRMLICLEEAQVVFSDDVNSAANQDLENRIQNFRKKGTGLFLLTHNATDISPRIRRLLQFKMYFRQSSDVAKYASGDLIFDSEDEKGVTSKLKTLGQRICAVNYISVNLGRKAPENSIFIEIPEVKEEMALPEAAGTGKNPRLVSTNLAILDKENKKLRGIKIYLMYLDEKISEGITDENGMVSFHDMLVNKEYGLITHGDKKKDARRFKISGGRDQEIVI